MSRFRLCACALLIVALPGVPAFAANAAQTKPAHAVTTTQRPTTAKKKTPPPRDAQVDQWLDIGGFGEVAIYKPKTASRGLVLFASGDGGWNLGVTDMAHQAVAAGFWVAGFSTPTYLKALDAGSGACSDSDGVLAKLGHDLVRRFSLPLDTRLALIGYSSGATIVYAALAADAGKRFSGGVSLGFCPDLLIKKPFCEGDGGLTQQKQQVAPFGYVFDKRETVDVPWRIVQGEADQVCDPKFAPEFAAGQRDTRAILLPKVGHGFGVPKNWMPQYIDSVRALAGTPTASP